MNQRLILEAMFKVLADRVLVLVTLVLTFALFAYSIMNPDYVKFSIVGMWAITVFIPVLKLKGGDVRQSVIEEREAA